MYIGYRKCPEGKTPWTDNYFGTQKSEKNTEFKENPNKSKFVLGIFSSAEAAIAHEIELHEANDVAGNPKFANQAKKNSTRFNTDGMAGENSPMYGKKRSEETKRKISENNARLSGENNPPI